MTPDAASSTISTPESGTRGHAVSNSNREKRTALGDVLRSLVENGEVTGFIFDLVEVEGGA